MKTACCLAIVIILTAAYPAPGHAGIVRDKSFATVHDLLDAAYPDLQKHGRFLTLCTGQSFANSWDHTYGITFAVNRFAKAVENPTDGQSTGKAAPLVPSELQLSGIVAFDENGDITHMEADRELVNESRNTDISQLIQSHPEWSESEAYAHLKQAGALYGPNDKAQFVKALRLEGYAKVFGRLRIKSVSFLGVSADRKNESVSMRWRVEATAEGLRGHPTYFFNFEPFEGKLVMLTRDHDLFVPAAYDFPFQCAVR